MAAVQIKYVPASKMINAYGANAVKFAQDALAADEYINSAMFFVSGVSQDAADEVFDLTNNPGRQEERVSIYGRGRSLSVGDIVVVYNPDFGIEQWLCLPTGWVEV